MTAHGVRVAVLAILLGACGNDQADAPGAEVDPLADAPPGCGAVPDEGVCASPTELARCVNDVVEVETCAAGCGELVDGPGCVPVALCDGVGPLGRCDGDLLLRCDDAPTIIDCTAKGATCAYRDDETGYACAASTAPHRIAGTITWEDRALSPGALGPPVSRPARGTMVSVVEQGTNTVHATVSAADDGSYVAHYDAAAGTEVRVVAYSRARSPLRPARVRNTAGYLHAQGSAPFVAGGQGAVDIAILASSTVGPAWNALDNAVTAMDWLRAHGEATLAPVYMYWQDTTSSGSYYQSGTNALHLDADDGFDDVVHLHELGHYVQDEYSASQNPGGPHNGSPADPRLAWGEGGATWFATAVRGSPYYIDYAAGGGWWVELEDRVHPASAGSTMSQPISEWMVAEVLWDLGDGPGGDDDPVLDTHASVFEVMTGYVTSPTLARGFAGLDLVEFLDGWFDHFGMASCTAMRALIRTKYGFPYDFAGPAGPCP